MHERHRRSRSLLVSLLVLVAVALSAAAPAVTLGANSISLDKVVGGLKSPTQITNANDGTDRLFVVEQRGTIRVIKGGVLQPGYFLDIRSKVADGGERGLLGLAFHPNFKSNHRFFVYYTRNGGDIVVSRFTTNSARTRASASTAKPLLLIEHSARDQPQRRLDRVRAERLPVRRRRRWRRRRRPGQRRAAEVHELPRQDPAHQRERVRAPASSTGTRSPSRIPSPARSRGSARSGRTACATRGASRSIAPTGGCSSPTSARTGTRR